MAITRDTFIEVLKDSYGAYYNLVPEADAGELPLAFEADYFARDEHYWFSKSMTVWGNEKNEVAYIFSAPRFDAALAQRCLDFAWEAVLPRVKPHKEHQYTNAKVIFVADSLEPEVVKTVQKARRSKSYHFSLHGYSELLAAAVDMSSQKTYTNPAGRDLAAYFKKLFAAREEKT